MREAHKRRIVTSTWRKNISKGLSGKKKSRQHRKNLSEATKGRKISKETRIKLSLKNKGKGNAMYGKHHSRLSKLKNKRSHLGKKASDKTKRKMRKSHKGKHTGKLNPMFGKQHSEKTWRRYRKTMRKRYPGGLKLTEEQKKKIAKKYKAQKPSKNTKIEKIIQSLCRSKKIKFQMQKRFEFEIPPPHYHRVDLFIQPNICVECDGDRFHANPKKYAPNDIIHRAYKSKHHHRKKHTLAKQVWKHDKHITQELQKQGNMVIRLWESDINKNPEKCIEKIIKSMK